MAGGGFGAPGDSGSLVVTQDTADPVALFFAGSDLDGAGNPVGDVLNSFQSGGNALTFVGGSPHAVIGCTLPVAPASLTAEVPLSVVPPEALQKAVTVRTARESELMELPGVQALGVGASQDSRGEAVIVFFVKKGSPRTGIPQEVDGVRTRIVEREVLRQQGILTVEQSAALVQPATMTPSAYSISEAEFARAKAVHGARVDQWMSKAGVQGLGIGSSIDAPGEAALIVFLIRGVPHEAIPATVDGVRTRVRESSPFVVGMDDQHASPRCLLPSATSTRKKHSIVMQPLPQSF